MSQNVPPQMEGQVDAPNPLELFWEQHRAKIQFVLFLVLAAMAGYYALQYYQEMQRDRAAKRFSQVTGLDLVLTEDVPMPGAEFARLDRDLRAVDLDALETYIRDEAQGTPYEPLAVWVAANGYLRKTPEPDLDAAERWAKFLKDNHANHFFCTETPYPPQVREEKEKDKDSKKKDDKDKKPKKPELEPALKGSPVSQLMDAIQNKRAFRKGHPNLFRPVDPEGRIVEIALGEAKIVVQLYEKAAPEHTKHFLDLVQKQGDDNFYNGQKVYRIARDPSGSKKKVEPRTIHFGLFKTKETQDSTQWDEAVKEPSGKILDFPKNEHVRQLSFFPGMLAAANEKDGKSSGERLFLTANDCASSFDGNYVILGKVISGLDELEALTDATSTPFVSQDEENLGVGKPADLINVSIKLQK